MQRNLAKIISTSLLSILIISCSSGQKNKTQEVKTQENNINMNEEGKVIKTDKEWKKILTPMQYHVLREKGTERPYTGTFNKHDEAGTYTCAACNQLLFTSKTKFESGCGWPSFNNVLDQGNITIKLDKSHNMIREEVLCSKCDGHLGHVFNDGPPPTYRRYCINSASLKFTPLKEE